MYTTGTFRCIKMIQSYIIDEIHKIRQDYAKRFDNDTQCVKMLCVNKVERTDKLYQLILNLYKTNILKLRLVSERRKRNQTRIILPAQISEWQFSLI